jgi:hypothetical protein
LGGPLQYSKVAHALIRLLALAGKEEIVRLLLGNFRNERDQSSDPQLRDERSNYGHQVAFLSSRSFHRPCPSGSHAVPIAVRLFLKPRVVNDLTLVSLT